MFMYRERLRQSNSGFTLIEVLVVIVIIGLISAIATPSFQNWTKNADLNADMRRLYGFFQKARMEAVTRNEDSTVTLTSDSYVLSVGGDVVHSGTFSDSVKMINSTNGLNFTYNSRGLISQSTTITLKRRDKEADPNGYRHDLVINNRGRMRIE
jgi:prepilin-type N-terminal cleavage/methylation domain-containing protein